MTKENFSKTNVLSPINSNQVLNPSSLKRALQANKAILSNK
jgi:hypothetical protein